MLSRYFSQTAKEHFTTRQNPALSSGWERWFAWRPVVLSDDAPMPVRWLDRVWRRRDSKGRWEYSSGFSPDEIQREREDNYW